MGVKGLTSLVFANDCLLNNYKLHNSKLVVDGTGIAFSLFLAQPPADYIFGGDYWKFSLVVKRFFENLLKSSVETIVFFDGQLDPDNKKMNTRLERMQSTFEEGKDICENGYGSIVPLFTKKVTTEVLDQLGIRYYICCGEADNAIAMAAKSLQCPVVSQDSDFFIFDLPVGNIPFSTLEWETIVPGPPNFLNAKIYYIENLIKRFPRLKVACLPLFATLCGNDFFPREKADLLLAELPAYSDDSGLATKSKRHALLINLLTWLSDKGLEAMEDCEAIFEETIGAMDAATMKEEISISSDMYKCNYVPSLDFDKLVSSDLPKHLSLSSVKDIIPWNKLLQVLCEQRSFCSVVIEDFSQPTAAIDCARKIRKSSYACLLKFFQTDLRTDSWNVEEFCRDGNKLVRREIKVHAASFEYSQTKEFIARQCGVNLEWLSAFDHQLHLFALSVVAWIKSKKTIVPKSHFYSLILYVWSRFGDCPFDAKQAISVMSYGSGRVNNICWSTVHCFSQFQALFEAVLFLNAATSSPFTVPNVHMLFEGRLLYNLVTGPMSWKPDVNDSLKTFLKQFPGSLKSFKSFMNPFIEDVLSEDDFTTFPTSPKKRSSKESKLEKAALPAKPTTVPSVNNNRFALLSLSDDM